MKKISRLDHEKRKSALDSDPISLPSSFHGDPELSLGDGGGKGGGGGAGGRKIPSSPSMSLKMSLGGPEPLFLPAPHLKISSEGLPVSPKKRGGGGRVKERGAAMFILMQWVLFCGASYDRTDKKFYRFFTKKLSKFAAKLNLIKVCHVGERGKKGRRYALLLLFCCFSFINI